MNAICKASCNVECSKAQVLPANHAGSSSADKESLISLSEAVVAVELLMGLSVIVDICPRPALSSCVAAA